ncbi:MAG TPA: GNAT family N-acetyltransferase [Chloroflexia bacterium]|nr:GNAT family N-acetyltransferase [Chloroflexia bacterium]
MADSAPSHPADSIEIRHIVAAEYPAVVRLINAADAVDGADDSTSEAEFRHWVASPTNAGCQFVAVAPGGAIVGYGDVHHQPGDDGAWGWVVVDPAWRLQGLGTQLADCVREHARSMAVLWIDFAVDVRLVEANRWLESLGYEPVRTYTRLRLGAADHVPLPDYPEGFTIRTFRTGADEATVCDILNLSFADHRNANVVSVEDMRNNLNRPGFQPDGLFLAETAEGEIAGLCWCQINEDEIARRGEQVGWINDLGVAPAYRRAGLGRALLRGGIAWLRDQGMSFVDLWVEGSNKEARTLYTATGFTVHKTVTDYRHYLHAAPGTSYR